MQEKTDVIIVGAGSGTRLGHTTPKAFVRLAGKPILYYSVSAFVSSPLVSSVILVVPSTMKDQTETFLNHFPQLGTKTTVTAGGDERWKSVRNGVAVSSAEWVMVHDAARPFVSQAIINSVLEKRTQFQSVITATPEVDTIRTFQGDKTGKTVDRTTLLRVGTPQLFRRELLMNAFVKASQMVPPPTDEAALIEMEGITVGFSWGDPLNFKITTPSDLLIAEALLERDPEMLLGR